MNWTDEWPTKPGWYWFHGWPWGKGTMPPRLYMVRAYKTINSLAFTTSNAFLYKSQAVGVWQAAQVPELPREVSGESK